MERYILHTEQIYPNVTVDRYVIMPNHIHILFTIHAENNGGVGAPRPTLPLIVRAIKGMTTREIGETIWQASFYDHVVRDEIAYQEIWRYIDDNPRCWQQDECYTDP